MTNLLDVDWNKMPPPEDDGGAAHLTGLSIPSLSLSATDGQAVPLSDINGRCVVYAFPMTGRPNSALPSGWDMIPGARGCTPQSCAFRDHAQELTGLGVHHLFGLSTQSTDYQREAVERLHLPFALLSDVDLALTNALGLPTFEVNQMTLLRRLTMVIDGGTITKVFYPVFPPDRNAEVVAEWLSKNR